MSLLTATMEHCDKYLLGTVGTPEPGHDRRAIDPCPTDWGDLALRAFAGHLKDVPMSAGYGVRHLRVCLTGPAEARSPRNCAGSVDFALWPLGPW